MLIENIATHRKQFKVLIDFVTGVQVDNRIVWDLRINILIVPTGKLTRNILQVTAEEPTFQNFVFGPELKRILRYGRDSVSWGD